jgi:hypothetical protein
MKDLVSLHNKPHDRRDVWKAWLTAGASYTGPQDMPIIMPCSVVPQRLLLYDNVKKHAPDSCVHFFQDDYKLERIWNKPTQYLPRILSVGTVIMPDFSVYPDMPNPIKAYNIYRSRAIGYWWQKQGLNVIPCLRCGDDHSDKFVFDGLPQNSTIAIGATGCLKSREVRGIFFEGIYTIIERLQPANLLIYGTENGKYLSYSLFTLKTKIFYYPSETGLRLRQKAA